MFMLYHALDNFESSQWGFDSKGRTRNSVYVEPQFDVERCDCILYSRKNLSGIDPFFVFFCVLEKHYSKRFV